MQIDRDYQLKTPRCILRHVSKDDIPHVFSATRVGGFNDGMAWDAPAQEDDLLEPYHRNCEAWSNGANYVFSVDYQDGSFVGRIAIGKTGTVGLWNVGFWTHPSCQGKGYMTEALGRVLAFGFEELAASEIDANHAEWNTASRKVLEKCGFIWREHLDEGFQKQGKWVPVERMSVKRDEWQESVSD